MEVKISVQNVARELELDTDESPEQLLALVEKAVASGGVLALSDSKGRQVIVPGSAIGWVQVGEPEKARVGFGG